MHFFVKYLFIAVLGGAIAGLLFFWHLENRPPAVGYQEFLADLDRRNLTAAEIRGNQLTLTDQSGRRYTTLVPDLGPIIPRLNEEGLVVTVVADRQPWIGNLLSITIPIALLFLFWILYQRKKEREAEGEGAAFAKGKEVFFPKGAKTVTFRDVAGIPEVKEELLEIIDFLQRPKKYSRLGATVPKGVLLIGPPGTGKTLLARAIAGEAGVPFFSFSGSDFVEMFVGVGASRVRDLFREAKKHTPCIIFIDEIDAVGGHRSGAGAVGGQEERAQTLNALLVEMDGFGQEDNIIILAATNRPDILDSALMRPGRFDRQVSLLPPDVKGRLNILQVHTRKVTMAAGVDLEDLARSTSGFTGAQLANLVNEAALIAARSDKTEIDPRDFEAAKDRILMGAERKGLVVSETDRRTMAFHEAGHAILARFLPEADPLRKISIVPRGRAMGHTQQVALDDRHAYSREYLKGRITILMGGRAAEEIALGQQTTGAEDDLRMANEIATKMVCRWGMNEAMGPRVFARVDDGLEQVIAGSYSEETARLLDHEIKLLMEQCYGLARDLLNSKRELLDDLAGILLQTETLDSDELEIVLECTRRKRQQEDQTTCEKV